MTFPPGNDPASRQKHLDELSKGQMELRRSSDEASSEIAKLVENDQKVCSAFAVSSLAAPYTLPLDFPNSY